MKPIKCDADDNCYVICDFCRYYNFNRDTKGRYVGNGCCKKHYMSEDPDGGCDWFHCFRAKL